jgi:succinyl-CoA synthetase beta subunit
LPEGRNALKIHEYQAKELFARQGIPIPEGRVATTPEEAEAIARELGGPVVIKAQVHVGGRGKAGGVKIAPNADEARGVAEEILGMKIKGLVVRKVLVAEAIDIATEAYVGIIVDRKSGRPVVMVSREGGIDIEQVAKRSPEKIHRLAVDPLLGLAAFQARQLAFRLYDDPATARDAAGIIAKLYCAFVENDASLAEINPLVVTEESDLIALDAKINIDDNGLFRRKEIEAMRDLDAEVPGEVKAREKGLSYIKLDGNVGCVVNGAGLAMATMDLIKRAGGEPANFLDIGGSSSPEKVTAAMEILLSDKNVRSVFFNIFGGITRCDDVAKGIMVALDRMKIDLPIVIRLTGTNEDVAREMLSKTKLISVGSMEEGAAKAIELAA